MALTFTEDYTSVSGNERIWVGEITFDSAYPAGGEAIAASDFSLDLIKDVIVSGMAVSEAGDIALGAYWDKTAGKIQLFESSATAIPLAEIGADDVSAYTLRIRVFGW